MAEIFVHDFGRRDPPPDAMPGEFPAALRRDDYRLSAGNCTHTRGPFTLLEAEGMAQCHCGEKVTLVHVFKLLANAENRLRQSYDYQRALVDSLTERTRFKCDHCGQFTALKPK